MSTKFESLTNQLIVMEHKIRGLGRQLNGVRRELDDLRSQPAKLQGRLAALRRDVGRQAAEEAGRIAGMMLGLSAAAGEAPPRGLPEPADFGGHAADFSVSRAMGRLAGMAHGLGLAQKGGKAW
jgi:hypothetical protein